MDVREWLRESWSEVVVGSGSDQFVFQNVRDRALLADGESVSIQAGKLLYSRPREDGQDVYYYAVECGYPSCQPPKSWDEYAETPVSLSTVWAYIPVEVVQEMVDAHGGIVGPAKRK